MAEKANITPSVLKWARESAKMSEETAAAKVSKSVEVLRAWETGKSQPTIRQAEKLAKLYRRPFALFFLPEIPSDFQPLQDFRVKNSKALGTASIFIIREIQQKQAWLRELYQENNEARLSFIGKFSLSDHAEIVADDILGILQIDPSHYIYENPVKEWIEKAEAKGIFISRTSFIHTRLKLDSEEIQGFAIADPYAPFVFVNSDDWNAPQLFTLVHELAHIWIAESGISNEITPTVSPTDKMHPVELFCNDVAANALMPLRIMKGINPFIFNSGKEVYNQSKVLGVSSFAFLVRAFKLHLIALDKYLKLKDEADEEFRAFIKREEEKQAKQKESEKKGGPDYYLLQLNKNSRLFTQTVLDAFRGGFLEATLASTLLNTKVNKFNQLESHLYK